MRHLKLILLPTSCISFSIGVISFKNFLTSACLSAERNDTIHGKISCSNITGTLHMNCHTSEVCSSIETFCNKRGKTC